MENNKTWYENYDKNKSIMWDCPKCHEQIPSGMVKIVNHWAECEGKAFHKELREKIKDPKFNINKLKKLRKKHFE